MFGADVAFHSASKYMNGHSDVIMGLIVTNDEDLHKRLKFLQNGEMGQLGWRMVQGARHGYEPL